MQVTPVNEKEYAFRNVWPKGVYACEVIKVEEGSSKKTGDGYFKCEVNIFNEQGGSRKVMTYVMAAGKAAWQLRAAAEAFGLMDQYSAGAIEPHHMEGKHSFAKVGIEEDESGQYEPKNIIREFTLKAPKGNAGTPQPKPPDAGVSTADIDDQIPF